MKKNYLLLALVITLFSCEKESILEVQDKKPIAGKTSSVEELDFQMLPEDITILLKDAKLFGNETKKNTSPFGEIRTDIPGKKVQSEKGRISYTFVLKNPNNTTPSKPSGYFFDNLVIYKKDKRADEIFVIRYIPTENWYNESKNFEDFTGNIIFYTTEGETVGHLEMINGEMADNPSVGNKKECSLFMDPGPQICSTIIHSDGYRLTTCYQTYDYNIHCSGSGGGDGQYPGYDNDGGPDDPDGLPDSGNGYTPPIMPEEEDAKISNRLANPCASLIFGQLLLLSTDYELPEIVDNNPDLESVKFSQAILNMFNDAQKYDYVVLEENMSNPEKSGETDFSPSFNSVTDRYIITTTLNSQYLSTSTRLSGARSIIHESVHAYLVYQQRLNPVRNVHELLNNYADNNGYHNERIGVIHHNFMAQFVNSIAHYLYVWDKNHGTGGNLGWRYYQDMAWGGLVNYRDPDNNSKILFYDEFEEYLSNFDDPETSKDEGVNVKERILNVIKNEAENNTNAKGDECP